jgi:hypothetical protein
LRSVKNAATAKRDLINPEDNPALKTPQAAPSGGAGFFDPPVLQFFVCVSRNTMGVPSDDPVLSRMI